MQWAAVHLGEPLFYFWLYVDVFWALRTLNFLSKLLHSFGAMAFKVPLEFLLTLYN
jgi:hypothetical protein